MFSLPVAGTAPPVPRRASGASSPNHPSSPKPPLHSTEASNYRSNQPPKSPRSGDVLEDVALRGAEVCEQVKLGRVAHEGVSPAAADQEVHAAVVATVEPVVAGATDEQIVTAIAVQLIVTIAAAQHVVAGASLDDAVAGAALGHQVDGRVELGGSIDDVGAVAAIHDGLAQVVHPRQVEDVDGVGASARLQRDDLRAADVHAERHQVEAVELSVPVRAGLELEDVAGVGVAEDHCGVEAATPVPAVGQRAGQPVVGVIAGTAEDRVVAEATVDEVVAGASVDVGVAENGVADDPTLEPAVALGDGVIAVAAEQDRLRRGNELPVGGAQVEGPIGGDDTVALLASDADRCRWC